ncbi:type II toxin-antitoxin system VapC family toxin [Subtercola boreus]|uniref:type II toxin-antitoxin system VapC family toxin n=1 Tax=Subtercola boreus TaxID=120213 RepID=UPI00155848C0|nr:type II toxin-antitoxin system VapC family toxin [Subtercola boreus]
MIYLDSCIVIYAVEDDGQQGRAVRRRLAELGAQTVVISSLVKLECLVGAHRKGDLALVDHYLRAFEQFGLVELGDAQYLRAAELQARHGIRTPDSLHLAAAQGAGCSELWTADSRLSAASLGLAVDVGCGYGV